MARPQTYLVGIVLFLGLQLIHQRLLAHVREKEVHSTLNRLFPVLGVILLALYLTWGMERVFQYGINMSVLLLACIIGIGGWVGGYIFRDWISGVVIKVEGRYGIDDAVCYQDTRGRISQMGYRSLSIETSDGTVVDIPYRALIKDSILQKIPRETACCVFEMTLPSQIHPPDLMDQLRTAVLSAPWSSPMKEPQIRIFTSQGNGFKAEIVAYLIDAKYASEIEAYVKKNFATTEDIPG